MNSSRTAAITMKEISRQFSYHHIVMITFSASYPQIELPDNCPSQIRINSRTVAQVNRFYRYAANTLYRQAVQEYVDSLKNDFPFRPFDAVMNYTVTLNQYCHLSTYHDRYEYTGGAHGNTVRASDSWDLKTGRRLPLASLFPPGEHYRRLLLDQILLQADANMEQNPHLYFEDYRELIVKNFDQSHFYLTEDGVTVYYLQYEIAPYSTGIVEFPIPYSVIGWFPTCFKNRS